MKAQILYEVGKLAYGESPVPIPRENEVLIRVRAAGICGSDIPRIFKSGAHKMPIIPGHEFSGEVESLGEGVDEKWKGKRVGVFPLIPCKKCAMCRSRHYELCSHYDYVGSRRDGAFAEYVTVPAENLVELPARVSFEQAAMLEPMSVAVHAMRRFGLGRKTVVLGMGTIGTLLSMFLLDAGCDELYVIGNKDAQRTRARELGIPDDRYFDAKAENAEEQIKQALGDGADLVFECVGTNQAYSQVLRLAAPLGKVVLVGNPSGNMALSQNDYWKILRGQLQVTGTWNSSFGEGTADDWGYVLERVEAGKIHPEQFITHAFELDEMEKGLKIMKDKTEDYCKVMIRNSKKY